MKRFLMGPFQAVLKGDMSAFEQKVAAKVSTGQESGGRPRAFPRMGVAFFGKLP